VKNITVSLPDPVYRRARIKAAERDTSVSALVREFLTKLGEEESDFERRKRLQDEVIASVRSFSATDRMARGDVHRRRALR
jgi:Arc/MetJ-type ribon-helix-helix transcriptional regulator